jgi:hypothetical protein
MILKSNSGARRFVNRGEKCCQFFRFTLKGADPTRGQQAAFFGEFQPEERFIRLLQDASDFVDLISFAAGATCGSVARTYGSRGTKDLDGYNFTFLTAGQSVCHCHYAQRKLVRALSCSRFIPRIWRKPAPHEIINHQVINPKFLHMSTKTVCSLCQHEIPAEYLMKHREEETREIIEYTVGLIKSNHPEWTQNDTTCQKCWDYYRALPGK